MADEPRAPRYIVRFVRPTPFAPPEIAGALAYGLHDVASVSTVQTTENVYELQADNGGAALAKAFPKLGLATIERHETVASRLSQIPGVIVEPERLRPLPEFGVSEAQAGSNQSWCLDQIEIRDDSPSGRGVTIAVLDSGLDIRHPDVSSRISNPGDAVSHVPWAVDEPGKAQVHGSHCFGIAGGPRVPSGGEPRFGVAYEARMLFSRVFSWYTTPSGEKKLGAYDTDVIEAATWAFERGARVLSLSLGSPRAVGQPVNALYETLAANAALSYGALVIAAAGNDSDRPYYKAPVGDPAACPSIKAVAAVDRQMQVAQFSNAGFAQDIAQLDVAAPGVAVRSIKAGGGHMALSGTSMACPHVAGLAALYVERNSNATAQAIWLKLLGRVLPIGPAEDFGAGLARA